MYLDIIGPNNEQFQWCSSQEFCYVLEFLLSDWFV